MLSEKSEKVKKETVQAASGGPVNSVKARICQASNNVTCQCVCVCECSLSRAATNSKLANHPGSKRMSYTMSLNSALRIANVIVLSKHTYAILCSHVIKNLHGVLIRAAVSMQVNDKVCHDV